MPRRGDAAIRSGWLPVLQVRAIGAATHVQAVLAAAAEAAAVTLGPNITTRTHTRSAGRIGYVRAYLTITRKETIDADT